LIAPAVGDRMMCVDHETELHTHRHWATMGGKEYNPAAAVYGIVICSAVLAVDAGLGAPTFSTVESILGALLIYWFAEAYAHLITSPPDQGGAKAWLKDARTTLGHQSPLVLTPLWLVAVVLVARLAGASSSTADTWALFVGVVLLGAAGARGAIRAGRHGAAVVAVALLGASFGLAAIGLKSLIHSVH
jgi:hypothetical protein